MLQKKAAINSAVAIIIGGITLSIFGVISLMYFSGNEDSSVEVENDEAAYELHNTAVAELGIEKEVHNYLKEYVGISSFGDEVFCSFEVLGTEEKETKINLYLWTLCSELYVAGGEIQEGGGVSQPLVLIVSEEDGTYTIATHKEPERGANYVSSAKALFPEEYHSKILPNETPYQEVNDRHKILLYWVRQKGAEYYGVENELDE